ncbi:MAG: ergothioneine biosynthesis protein EgtB [Planctomycetes bacterium]|nr:ergothioneine biosynthesis protein EgtB [Planctomycetota bacterium]
MTTTESILCAVALRTRFDDVRRTSLDLVAPLAREDMVVQSMPDVSPTKWHLAHTSWFFETFVLANALDGYAAFDPRFADLFNSYYQGVGEPFSRERRGLLTRPTVDEVLAYRAHVDAAMHRLFETADERTLAEVGPAIEVGLHHEQQHQELMLMDVKHVLAENPMRPAYDRAVDLACSDEVRAEWFDFDGGDVEIGAAAGFAFDNERPRHQVLVQPFELSSRLVTVGEFRDFLEDGGYERPEFWLADGWALAKQERWNAPLYWERDGGTWLHATLRGWREIRPEEPVCHVSYYEADAFARWAGCRLPTEQEWELAAAGATVEGGFLESGALHPRGVAELGDRPAQLFGDVWEWTSSPYTAYPGFEPFAGDMGEYNGKFMINQFVLRGGSCVTPRDHVRATYRNFYYPHQRWMFAGLRLAR